MPLVTQIERPFQAGDRVVRTTGSYNGMTVGDVGVVVEGGNVNIRLDHPYLPDMGAHDGNCLVIIGRGSDYLRGYELTLGGLTPYELLVTPGFSPQAGRCSRINVVLTNNDCEELRTWMVERIPQLRCNWATTSLTPFVAVGLTFEEGQYSLKYSPIINTGNLNFQTGLVESNTLFNSSNLPYQMIQVTECNFRETVNKIIDVHGTNIFKYR
jgi:hypothetical protein